VHTEGKRCGASWKPILRDLRGEGGKNAHVGAVLGCGAWGNVRDAFMKREKEGAKNTTRLRVKTKKGGAKRGWTTRLN